MKTSTLRIAFLSSAALIGIAIPAQAFAAEAEAQTLSTVTDAEAGHPQQP